MTALERWFPIIRRSGVSSYLSRSTYPVHRNEAKPHRALRQSGPAQTETGPPPPVSLADYRVRRRAILGGLTHEYQIAA